MFPVLQLIVMISPSFIASVGFEVRQREGKRVGSLSHSPNHIIESPLGASCVLFGTMSCAIKIEKAMGESRNTDQYTAWMRLWMRLIQDYLPRLSGCLPDMIEYGRSCGAADYGKSNLATRRVG